MRRALLAARVAWRDLLHERALLLCSVVGLAAVLLPLLVLFGLKHGVMEGLRAELVENPRTRTITNAANRAYDEAFLDALRARPDVAFAVGRIRSISGDVRAFGPRAPDTPVGAELWATGPGDPLLGPGLAAPGLGEAVLSRPLAASLGAEAAGAEIVLRARRGAEGGGFEVLNLHLRVAGVAPAGSAARNVAFVDPRLLLLVDGFTDREFGAETDPAALAPTRPYAGFRAHARRLEDVPQLDAALRGAGHEVETRAAEVAGLLGLDRSLGLLFGLIAGLGGTGYLLSLGVGLWANVERKRRQLAQLRMQGLRRGEMVLVPLVQALVVALAGSLLAAVGALLVADFVNRLDLSASGGGAACVILPWHLMLAGAATVAGAALASAVAGLRAARVAPAEGMREE